MHGTNLLSAILRDQNKVVFRSLRIDWFVQDEVEVFNEISRHVQLFGQLPSFQVLLERGHDLPTVDQPVEYYLQQTTDRFILDQGGAQIRELHRCLQSYDAQGVQAAYDMFGRNLLLSRSSLEVSTLSDEIDRVVERSLGLTFGGIQLCTTGYSVLDEYAGGFEPGTLNFLVGRPGTGKSMILLHMAKEAWQTGKKVLFVSLEMSGSEMVARCLGEMMQVNPTVFTRARTPTPVIWRARSVAEAYREVDDQFYLLASKMRSTTVADIESAVLRLQPDVVYVDAFYFLKPAGRHMSRREGIAEVAEALRGLATGTNLPFIASAQLNREGTKKGPKQEELTTLGLESVAETDVIPQVATILLGIHPPTKSPINSIRRKIELMKHRSGNDRYQFLINYSFDPPNFSYLSDADGEISEEDIQRQMENLGWQI